MACVTATGELAPSGRALLELLLSPHSPENAAAGVAQPLFRVRASLRELHGLGWVVESDAGWVLTPAGAEQLERR